MTRLLMGAATAASICFSGPAHAEAGPSSEGMHYLSKGSNQSAAGTFREQVNADPDNLEAMTMWGVAAHRAGLLSDAYAAFSLSQGSLAYEQQGIDAHADVLRQLGKGADAAHLRLTQMTQIDRASRQLAVLCEAAQDHLSVGDLAAAEKLIWQAMAQRPNDGMAQTCLARLFWEQRDQPRAEYHLWRAELSGGPRLQILELRATIYLANGQIERADAALATAKRIDAHHIETLVLRAQVLTAQGAPREAMTLLRRPRYRLREEPNLLLAVLQAARETDPQLAQSTLARLKELAPEHPQVKALGSAVTLTTTR